MDTGKLIVFEGIDGSGKTTQSKRLQQWLNDQDIPCRWFREPGDSSAGKRIRELANSTEPLSPEQELELFVQDRKHNIAHNLLPNLSAGIHVILDRYYFSTACYQGARGLDVDTILHDHQGFAPQPDLALYIDVDAHTALERIRQNRAERAARFEIEEYLNTVRNHYLDLCHKGLLIRLDGSRDLETVWQEVREISSQVLAIHR